MKTQTSKTKTRSIVLALVLLTLGSVQTLLAQVGSTCANPEIISTLPFSQTGKTTSGFGDDYSTNSCNNSYLGGDDFVYSFTPASSVTVGVALSNTATWTGLFIFDGCPSGGTCVAFQGSSAANPSVSGINLTGGTTYYIIISTYPSPQSTSFDINISEQLPFEDMLSGTQTVTTCGSTFRDNGGSGNYTNNFSGITTFKPASAGQKIQLNFTSFNTEASWDFVTVYDGPNDTYPVLVNAANGTSIPTGNPFTSTALGGELTFKFTSDGSGVRAGWEANVTCSGVATCDDPSALGVSGITTSSANLSWTENGSAANWDIELGTAGFSPTGTPTANDINSNPYPYTGLTPATSYDYYVRAECGGLQSSWVGPFNFSTLSCNVQPPSALTATNIASTYADLGWTENGNSIVWDIELGTAGFSPTGTPTANNVSTNPYSYGGLSSLTSYDFYVRAQCGASTSSWVGPFNFTTTSFPTNYTSELVNGWARSVVQDPSGNYVWAGYATNTSTDFQVVKTDKGGNIFWAKTIGGSGTDMAFDLVNSGDGGYVIVGHTNSAELVISGSYDIMVTKLDANGGHVWTRVFGTTSSEYSSPCSIIENGDGTFTVTGTTNSDMFSALINANGTLAGMRTLNTQAAWGSAIVKASGTNGGWVAAGKYQGPLGSEYMITKTKSNGTYDWSMVWGDGTGTSEVLSAIVENSANDYTVFGYTYAEGTSPKNMYVARFTNSGGGASATWIKAYGTTEGCEINDAVKAADGNYIVTGLCSSAGAGTYSDTYLMKINASNGSIIWQTEKPDDGTGNRQGDGVFIDNNGSFLVAGLGGFDMLKFAPDGTICDGIPGSVTVDDLGTTFPNLDVTEGQSSATFGVTDASKTPALADFGTLLPGCNLIVAPPVLPLELSSFETTCHSDKILCQWTTKSEENVDFFTIERSKDGIHFDPIETISAKGNSKSYLSYEYADKNPLLGISYYRLKETDLDQRFDYSSVNMVTSNCLGLENDFILHPNPTQNQFSFSYTGSGNLEHLSVQIINVLGETVFERYYDSGMLKGSNQIDIHGLSNGMYQILFNTDNFKVSKRLIKK